MAESKSQDHSVNCGACAYEAALDRQAVGNDMLYQEGAGLRKVIVNLFRFGRKPVDPNEEKH